HSILLETEKDGVIAKADTIGSLEALATLLKEAGVTIKKLSIGNISKKDIADARVEKDPIYKVILGFNIESVEEASDIKQITHDVIYKIIEDYNVWKESILKKEQAKQAEAIVHPFKIKVMEGFVFRQSNPAVVGAQVLGGIIAAEMPIIKKDGSKLSVVKTIQEQGKNVASAAKDKEIAVAIPNVTVGRQLKEGDILYADLTEEQFKRLKGFKKYLKADEIDVIKEIVEIKRKQNPMWGV
ncbi:MAG: translation initiation factor IF-2, partial [Nanoarchaeota archaeon]